MTPRSVSLAGCRTRSDVHQRLRGFLETIALESPLLDGGREVDIRLQIIADELDILADSMMATINAEVDLPE